MVFQKKRIETIVCELHSTDHRFLRAKRISAEILEVEDLDYQLYVGVEPILFDTRNHPCRWLRRLKTVKLFFYRFGEPFVRLPLIPPYNGSFLNPEKKLSTLLERGKYQIIVDKNIYDSKLSKEKKEAVVMPKWPLYLSKDSLSPSELKRVILHPSTGETILPCYLSDMDFARDDYGANIKKNMFVDFTAASDCKSRASDNIMDYFLFGLLVISAFYFMAFGGFEAVVQVLDMLFKFVRGL